MLRPRWQSLQLGREQDHSPGFQECPVVQEALALLEVPRNKQPEKARQGSGRVRQGQAGVRQGSEDSDRTERIEISRAAKTTGSGNRKGFKMAADKTGKGTCRDEGRGLYAHHSPSSLWDRGDRPCLECPETQDGVSRIEAGARPGALWFLRNMAWSSQRENSKRPIRPHIRLQARLAWPDQTCRAWACGCEGFCFVFLEDFCCLGLQREPWCTVPYDLASAAWGEAGAEIRVVQKWKSSFG